MRNEKGFALIAFLGFLPLLLTGVLCLYVFIGLLEDRTAAQQTCRRNLLSGLEKAGVSIKALMDLNPVAASLSAANSVATASLAAAVATGNPAGVAAATTRLKMVIEKQKALEAQQKLLYGAAKARLAQTQLATFSGIQKQPLGFLKILVLPPQKISPALHPTGSGLAPVYALDQPFEKKQAVAQKWHLRLNFDRLNEFFKNRSEWKEICAATLRPEGGKWRAHLSEARF